MNICSYFRSASKSSVVSSSSNSEDLGQEITTKSGKKTFPWLEFEENLQGAFCKLCKKGGRSLQRTGGVWITKPFTNWKKVTQNNITFKK